MDSNVIQMLTLFSLLTSLPFDGLSPRNSCAVEFPSLLQKAVLSFWLEFTTGEKPLVVRGEKLTVDQDLVLLLLL